MNLPLVNIFPNPYEAWTHRDATQEEMIDFLNKNGFLCGSVRDKLIDIITTPLEAAVYIAKKWDDNSLASFINDNLDNDTNFKLWRQSMPSKIPKALSQYQTNYPNCDFEKVNDEIIKNGLTLSEGQFLFHGGIWPDHDKNKFVTDRPLSTTFCPQVALRSAEWKGKAYDANRIDILVLHVHDAVSKVYVYRRRGTNLGHENEVLFATGAKLYLRSETLICNDYPVQKWNCSSKKIPVYVLEVDIS